MVTQYALDSSAYNFWNALKANTENVGTLFDPQPNQNKGNIHCVNDTTERVIGYIGAGSTQQYRLFISNSSMPSDWNQEQNCSYLEVPPIKDSIVFYFTSGFDPIDVHTQGITILGYYGASSTCVDCTLTGSPIKPSFWP